VMATDVLTMKEDDQMQTPPIVSAEDWHAAREQLLIKEKELSRARDALAAERRRMPWVAVDKEYWFEGPAGRVSFADLFEGRRQLIVYRAFYGPEVTTYAEGGAYPERACVGCSWVADQVAHPGHLHARNTALAFASRAPPAEIKGLNAMGGLTSPGTRSPTTSTRTTTSTNGMAPTPSSARATGSSGPTSSTIAATSRWATPGTTSTSPLLAVRRPGRTRRRATRKRRRTSGGTTTTCTTRPSNRADPDLLSRVTTPARAGLRYPLIVLWWREVCSCVC
jgi:hypothetical protein